MTKEDTLKIGLALQGIALSLDDRSLERVKDKLKEIETIVAKETNTKGGIL